ncbi:MAG: hypothetical protein HRT87_07595 [Legionellales bacterium]|jgi:hypothetical protein|nr:hypothetical protein [Legionellales bacterium]
MGEYKEKKGKTRVGNFLKSIKGVAPEVLNLVGNVTGMDMLKNLGNAIKNDPIMSVDDKATAQELLKLDISEMEEVTKRWSSDMVSDSWLSKNIRPIVLAWLVIFVSLFAVVDSIDTIDFTVEAAWITLFSTLLVTVIVSYFGSRGVEKYQKIKK